MALVSEAAVQIDTDCAPAQYCTSFSCKQAMRLVSKGGNVKDSGPGGVCVADWGPHRSALPDSATAISLSRLFLLPRTLRAPQPSHIPALPRLYFRLFAVHSNASQPAVYGCYCSRPLSLRSICQFCLNRCYNYSSLLCLPIYPYFLHLSSLFDVTSGPMCRSFHHHNLELDSSYDSLCSWPWKHPFSRSAASFHLCSFPPPIPPV